jgi:hypothetical protein
VGWNRVEYAMRTDKYRAPLWSPRIAAFSPVLLNKLRLF